MKLLLDTHILLWGAVESERLPGSAAALIEDPDNEVTFSVVSLWEVAIKTGGGRADFRIDAGHLRRSLLDNGYAELAESGRVPGQNRPRGSKIAALRRRKQPIRISRSHSRAAGSSARERG